MPDTVQHDNHLRAGWWPAAEARFSPNHDNRSEGQTIHLIVLHHISLPSGCFSGNAVIDFFENRLDPTKYPELAELMSLRVSAHFFIRRDGQALQFVNCDNRAWHAGISCWRGQTGCNDFSIGVELEGDACTAFSDPQYATLNQLLTALAAFYPIEAITTHSEIAAGRKLDPGPTFDWSKLSQNWAF